MVLERAIPVVALTPATRSTAITEHFREIHAGLRSELVALRQSVDDYLAGSSAGVEVPRPEPGEALRRHCVTFCAHLHGHHTREDGAFDAIERNVPGIGYALDRLRAEHVQVAELNSRIATLVESLGTGADEVLREELADLGCRLEEHFDYEEKNLGPIFDAAA